MEAKVWYDTGLLPQHLAMVRLAMLEDGRWQARFEFEAGAACSLEFAAEGVESQVAGALQRELGFTAWAAGETARRLVEPFELAAAWQL